MVYVTKFVKLLEKMAECDKKEINEILYSEGVRSFDVYIQTELKKVPERLLERSFIAIEKIYRKLSSSLASLDSKMSTYVRSVIANRFGRDSPMHKLSKEIVKISYEEKGALIKKQKDSLIEKNTDIPSFDTSFLTEVIKKGIESDDKYHKMVALLLCSGSRPYELLVIGRYEVYSINYITQYGIAKSRELESVVKPLILIDSDTFIKEVEKLRESFKDTKLVEEGKGGISGVISSSGNRFIKKLFDNKDISLSSMRSIYPGLSYEMYKNDKTYFKELLSLSLWTNKVLGHSRTNLKTGNHYNTVSIN